MFHGCHPPAPASLRSPGDHLHPAVTQRFGQETEGRGPWLSNEMPQRTGIEGWHPIQGTVAALPLTGGCAPPVPGVHGWLEAMTRDFSVSEKDLAETG